MKKILILFIVLFLASCEASETQGEIKVIVPNGSPALAQVWIEEGISHISNQRVTVNRVSGVDPLVAAFATSHYDVIIAPSNLGARLSNGNYKMVAGLTYGNLYLASIQSQDLTLSQLENQTLVVFGQNAIPDLVLKVLLNSLDITPKKVEYVATIGDAHQRLIQDPSLVILSAEPQLSMLMSVVQNIKTLDIQDAWFTVTGSRGYLQSAVFMKTSFIDNNTEAAKAYLSFLNQAASDATLYKETTAQKAEAMGYGFPKAILIEAIARSYIQFTPIEQAKEDLEVLIDMLDTINMGFVFGPSRPVDTFYHTFS